MADVKHTPTVLGQIDPQPPKGIKYMLGNEPWLPAHDRGLIRLHCEEWGNLGPMELNTEIKHNKAGFRVRLTSIIAPPGAHGFTEIEGVYYWTDMDFLMDKPGIGSTNGLPVKSKATGATA